jgi:hypothetical protein
LEAHSALLVHSGGGVPDEDELELEEPEPPSPDELDEEEVADVPEVLSDGLWVSEPQDAEKRRASAGHVNSGEKRWQKRAFMIATRAC